MPSFGLHYLQCCQHGTGETDLASDICSIRAGSEVSLLSRSRATCRHSLRALHEPTAFNRLSTTTVASRKLTKMNAEQEQANLQKNPQFANVKSSRNAGGAGEAAGAGGGAGGAAGAAGPKRGARPKPCKKTDYTQHCPQGWTELEPPAPQGLFGGMRLPTTTPPGSGKCVAPSDYNPPAGMDCSTFMYANLSKKQKKIKEVFCQVKWPCDGSANPDYSQLCPSGWQYFTDGSCRAPFYYRGPCKNKMHFLGFTKRMKESWGQLCNASWPKPKKWYQFWRKPLPETPESKDMKKNVSESIWSGNCERDYMQACPEGWDKGAAGWCNARPGVASPDSVMKMTFVPGQVRIDRGFLGLGKPRKVWLSQCPSAVKTERFTDDMKAAFAAHCGTQYKCKTAAMPAEILIAGIELGRLFL
eukprot:TRINITY_DN3548_c0_g2_i2.p1 TRINITY_DN3548_c0_g2~~TRINITY_DN3548_c0_g2_i2.p1  ORF type:complete len:415 (-),score=35.67 TRINITY_DN3548_c0_g2_i2:254-1498(-)